MDRGRYRCALDGHTVRAMRARELGRGSVVVGDRVRLVGDLTGGPGVLARIVRVEPRRSVLRRTADDDDPTERVMVANADQLVIVTALADPPPRTGLVDRCLVAAYDAGLAPLLCLTKADLAAPGELLGYYAELDLDWVACRYDEPVDPLGHRLTGHLSVLVGHSGVGKSTLVNALVPAAERATGEVSAIGRGRHTSSSVAALPLPDGGWVVDTPGVRSFGLAHVSATSLLSGFPDLEPGTADCPPSCTHLSAVDGCALDDYVVSSVMDRTLSSSAARLHSYRRLLASR